PMAAVVLFFFVSSTAISGIQDDLARDDSENERRSGLQVWANGFGVIVCLVLAVTFESPVFLLGAISAIAVATADTWATELRSIKTGSTFLLSTFEPAAPGTDGGVSLKGSLWGVGGSLSTAVISMYVFSLQLEAGFVKKHTWKHRLSKGSLPRPLGCH